MLSRKHTDRSKTKQVQVDVFLLHLTFVNCKTLGFRSTLVIGYNLITFLSNQQSDILTYCVLSKLNQSFIFCGEDFDLSQIYSLVFRDFYGKKFKISFSPMQFLFVSPLLKALTFFNSLSVSISVRTRWKQRLFIKEIPKVNYSISQSSI